MVVFWAVAERPDAKREEEGLDSGEWSVLQLSMLCVVRTSSRTPSWHYNKSMDFNRRSIVAAPQRPEKPFTDTTNLFICLSSTIEVFSTPYTHSNATTSPSSVEFKVLLLVREGEVASTHIYHSCRCYPGVARPPRGL